VDEAAEAAAAAERYQQQKFLDHCLVHGGFYRALACGRRW